MNLELIKKYLPEFNGYVKGQPLTLGYKTHWGTYEWTDLVWADWDSSINEHIIIINDEYLPYRKALAEGKTVQYNAREGENDITYTVYGHLWWVDTTEFKYATRFYRIKPEEPKFKVGDYVRYIHTNSPKPLRIININCERYYFENAEIILRVDEIEKWEPKEGDLCIVWNNDNINYTVIIKFDYIDASGKYSCSNTWWDNCMPFTGVLPPHMKDN